LDRAEHCAAPWQVLETVLSYLQLENCLPGSAPFISPLPDMRATLNLAFHRSSPEDIAQRVPMVAKLLELAKHRAGRYVVSIPALASELGISFSDMQETLRELSAAGEVSFTLHDLALAYTVRLTSPPRAPSLPSQIQHQPDDIASLVSALAARLASAERSQVGKLDKMYNAAADAALLRSDAEQEASLRRAIAAYFDAPADASEDCSQIPAPVRAQLLCHADIGDAPSRYAPLRHTWAAMCARCCAKPATRSPPACAWPAYYMACRAPTSARMCGARTGCGASTRRSTFRSSARLLRM